MEYIDKEKFALWGRGFTQSFLDNHCKDAATGRHSNVSYHHFYNKDECHYMRRLLYLKQRRYCCYCMRRLIDPEADPKDVTIEHIIPKATARSNTAELSKYIGSGLLHSPVHGNMLIHREDFEALVNPSTPPYPFTVAYDNMAASCNGAFRQDIPVAEICNCKRATLTCLPVYFHPDIRSMVEYTPQGEMKPVDGCALMAEITEVRENAYLDFESLKDIRRIWYCLRKKELADVKAAAAMAPAERKEFLLVAMAANGVDGNEIDRLTGIYKDDDRRWELLLRYDWFHGYYRASYP